MRARLLKPGFFANEDLAELDFSTRLLFCGLWTIADREGRLDDRPKRIKAALFPYDDGLDISAMLDGLQRHGFIRRYCVGSEQFIEIANFKKHQHPHVKEPASTIPAPDWEAAGSDFSGTDPAESDTESESESESETESVAERVTDEAEAVVRLLSQAKVLKGSRRLTEAMVEQMCTDFEALDVRRELSKFQDYNLAKGRQLKDEAAAFRNWLRKAEDYAGQHIQAPGTTPRSDESRYNFGARLRG